MMRSLNRNKRKIYYALRTGDLANLYEYGNETGERTPNYGGHVALECNISAATGQEAVEAFEYLSRMEGIIPAIESAHAVAHAMKIAPEMDRDEIIMICMSGRGDKDVRSIAEYRGVDLNE